MELNWNDAALCSQFACGLHWEVQRQVATRERQPCTLGELQDAALIIDNALHEEHTSHPQQGNKSGKSLSTPNWGGSTGQQATKTGPLSSNPNYKASVKCSKVGHKYAKCQTRWKATPKEDKGKAKESTKIGKESKYQSGKNLPVPYTITMLDGSCPQAGKIWKKTNLTFSFDGKKITETFLICNTGSHAAILGLKWLDAYNPEIDWNMHTLSFSHTPPEQVTIAEEEEANKDPLKRVPPEYHQYAKVFGEEELNKLPPHWHYNIEIELTEDGPLSSPLDKLKAGKIQPSKSSISSPMMFVPKKDGSCCLVVDYCCLNNQTKNNVYPLPHPDNLMAQLCVKEGNRWKTKFWTKYGLYKSLVMTFELTNAPAVFQHFMNKLFKDLLDVCVIIYLDDILIYSKEEASHTKHIHEVLWHLMANQLFCKASNCFSLDKLKIQAVQDWPLPTKAKEVQSFLH
ncbi:Retrotransposable element Tf2 protein [Rhizoctonia solani]|uniref:Retrotransposable element Tf2 protein n=1 Tax=Rhizoctonia solani TaxID=456999 RepID=A0A8H8SWG1_9AGAM|nr:Retrotransposable element Tf2 protein [Rhizoctonia solani]QRW20514.1 Retrotransposable element Tf2 protein [Rhizoctonia solani]